MTQRAKTGQRKTYSMELAQLPASETTAMDRSPLLMGDSIPSGRVPPGRGVGMTRVIESLDNAIPLPNDRRSFFIFLGVLLVVGAGMMVHVLLSAQILQAEVELVNKQAHHTVVERQNGELLWLIGRATNLAFVEERAKNEGYRPIERRQYVEVNGDNVTIRDLDEESADALTSGPSPQSPPAQQAPVTIAPAFTDAPVDSLASDVVQPVSETTGADALLRQWREVFSARTRPTKLIEVQTNEVGQQEQTHGGPAGPAWISEISEYVSGLFSGTGSH